VAVAEEETGSSDVDSGGDLESFAMKGEIPRDELLFIGLKLLATVLNNNRF
jgi:hypothetical protein